jgi:hypothetical protein
MLREELEESDIPHRTAVRDHIMEVWDEHLEALQNEMAVSFFVA